MGTEEGKAVYNTVRYKPSRLPMAGWQWDPIFAELPADRCIKSVAAAVAVSGLYGILFGARIRALSPASFMGGGGLSPCRLRPPVAVIHAPHAKLTSGGRSHGVPSSLGSSVERGGDGE